MPPNSVDLSPHLRYIRWQGGGGCWGYSLMAMWDIMNDLVCPFTPNLSMSLGLYLMEIRHHWEPQGGIMSPDGRFFVTKNTDRILERTFGTPTEGTEITNPTLRWRGNWTMEGINEAGNYRLSAGLKTIPVTVGDIQQMLADNHPVQIQVGQHDVTLTGYDNATSKFTFVNSLGDRFGNNGFSTYSYDDIKTKKGFGPAYVMDPIPPRPVPAARIKVSTPNDGGYRLNVNLWLSAEKSPRQKRKIWPPPDSQDPSRTLHYTVRLPSGFVWPPSPENRLVLDLYDSGEYSETGGQIEEFTVAFGNHIFPCQELTAGPAKFAALEHRRLTIP